MALPGFEAFSMAGVENPKSVLRKAKAARLRRALAEDRLDAQWKGKRDRIVAETAKESGLSGFDLLQLVSTKLPPHPRGWFQRLEYCNRCNERIVHNEQHDAYFCPRCRRWIERRCGDPTCQFCRQRPARPSP
jgi:hypothetical protein